MNLTTQKKSPGQRAEIDKDIDKNYIVSILQKYKTAKRKVLKKRIHLTWEGGVIEWSEAEKSLYGKVDPDIEAEIKKELAKMRDHINFSEKQIESFQEQYNASLLCQLVEWWLSELTSREAEVIFRSYIDHDYEKRVEVSGYITLSNREIARKMGVDEKTIRKAKERALRKILTKSA